MRFLLRLLLLFIAVPTLLLTTGCEEQVEKPEPEVDWGDDFPVENGENGGNGEGNPEEEVIRDTAYIVVDKRQAGGGLEPSGEVSEFDGRPRMERTELESMIIVEGNKTGQTSAYLLPPNDYNRVSVGHRLKESTLGRWESVSENHIPPPPSPEEEESGRSRTGGAAEQFSY